MSLTNEPTSPRLSDSAPNHAPELRDSRAQALGTTTSPRSRPANLRGVGSQGVTRLPLVSIVIVAMNDEDYIARTIDSALGQDYPALQIHVQHGAAGTDRTLEIIKTYEGIRWASEHDTGFPDGANRGLRATTGEIVILEGGDDLLLPGAVRALVAALTEHQDAGFAYGDIDYIDSTGEPFLRLAGRPFDLDEMFWSNQVTTQSVAFRRLAFDMTTGPYRTDVINADWDLFIRLGARFPAAYVPKVLAQYRVHDRSNTLRNMAKMAWSMCAVADSTLEDPAVIAALRRGRPRAFAGSRLTAALLSVLANDRCLAWSHLRRAVTAYPKAVATRHGVMALAAFALGARGYERLRRRGRKLG